MKRILLILCIFIFTTGCVNIKKEDYKLIINDTIKENNNNKIYNRYSNGYKYYLPKYMSVKKSLNYNEEINSNDYTYFLYIDIISYYNKVNVNFEENKKNYISYKFKYNKNDGYLSVKEVNNKYLVEILYNYAKIEVKVDYVDINEVINNSIIILSTIKYDDKIIESLIRENKLNSEEETLNIFETKEDKNDFMEVVEEYDKYEEESDIPDYDIINKEDN